MKIIRSFAAVCAILFFGGCASGDNEAELAAMSGAKQMIRSGEAECVLVRNGEIVAVGHGNGVSPLLELFDREREKMKDATVVDKVIGRAAAFIAINGNAQRVHGEVMSEDAVALLSVHGIEVSCKLLVPLILNRSRDGLCPLEQSVLGIDDPEKALASLRERVNLLASGGSGREKQ